MLIDQLHNITFAQNLIKNPSFEIRLKYNNATKFLIKKILFHNCKTLQN